MLRNGFDYDLWANRRWITSLPLFKTHLSHAHEVLEHIHQAQIIWLERCGMPMLSEQENLRLEDLFATTTLTWQSMIDDMSGEEPITYRTFAGEQYTNSMAQIAYHVLNHGTYHRGHLRGLAQAEGIEGFPETDLILYLRKRDQGT